MIRSSQKLFCTALAIALMAGTGFCEENTEADKTDFRQVKGIEGFAARAKNVETVSIPGPDRCAKEKDAAVQAEARKAMAWGQAMLQDLQDLPARAEGKETALAGDALVFRDWCLGAPGAGNLLLATAAEETAADLLFRALAVEKPDEGTIRRLLAVCTQRQPTAEYWLESLGTEGESIGKWSEGVKEGEPEYLRLAALLNAVWKDFFASEETSSVAVLPEKPDFQCGRFLPFLLMRETMLLSNKEIALEACLSIQNAIGEIPKEREAFIHAAEKHAERILRNRERLTGSMVGNDVWECWEEALKEAGGK